MLELSLQFLTCRHTVSCRLSHLGRNEFTNVQLFSGACEWRCGYHGGWQGHGGLLDLLIWRVHVVIFSKSRAGGLFRNFLGSFRMANLLSQIKQSIWRLPLGVGRNDLNLVSTVDWGADSGGRHRFGITVVVFIVLVDIAAGIAAWRSRSLHRSRNFACPYRNGDPLICWREGSQRSRADFRLARPWFNVSVMSSDDSIWNSLVMIPFERKFLYHTYRGSKNALLLDMASSQLKSEDFS